MRPQTLLSLCFLPILVAQDPLLPPFHAISSHTALDHVKALCAPEFAGRLGGTQGYLASAQWCVDRMKAWGVQPGAADGTWFQRFPNPYTLIRRGCEVTLHVNLGKDRVDKHYAYEKEFYPGGTTDTGTVTAEVVYVGYGITAPELGYDDYAGLDVKGKIVAYEPEVPVGQGDPERFKKWRPYSFHDAKTLNAWKHGAAGVVVNYLLANPNNVWRKGLVMAAVGPAVMGDLFAGTGRSHRETVQAIRKDLKPQSLALGKTMTLKMASEHHPEGVGLNVVGKLEGRDPALKHETILIGAHLDHLGYQPELIPGANDNASACAVLLLAAEALSKVPLQRSVVFVLFDAEEQGVKGAEYCVAHPTVPRKDLKAMLNLESVGRGEGISGGFGGNFPDLWKAFETANAKFVHRPLQSSKSEPLARPRQDALHFFWAGVPTIGFGTFGGKPLGFPWYHTTQDLPENLTPEIMEDVAKLVFLGTAELANR